MRRNLLAALCLTGAISAIGALVVTSVAPTPARACGYIRAPVNTKAEIAAIKKALPKAKLSDTERQKVLHLLATARKGKTTRMTADFEKALADTMVLLRIERIFRKESCMTIRIPVVTS